MTIINTKTNESHERVSFMRGAEIIGVDRKTLARWFVKRMKDKTFMETYNHFQIYFKAKLEKKKTSYIPPIKGQIPKSTETKSR